MKAGFAKTDITPRVSVELAGFGPFIHRYSKDVRDQLYSRAMAVSDGDTVLLVVSNDIVGINPETMDQARQLIQEQTGVPPERCMLHATHTHSGPGIRESFSGWGEPDPPYMELLPYRIADACARAVEDLEDAEFSYASVPAAHISYNREHQDMPVYEEALKDDWEPEEPEKTDLTAYTVAVRKGDKLAGFISSYSCHPVVCCQKTHSIHGDYAGVATNKVEKEQGGAVGLFLQGTLGDINTCVVHTDQERSMKGLDIIAERYARIIRKGLEECKPMAASGTACALTHASFTNEDWSEEYLRDMIETFSSAIRECSSDEDYECRMNMVKMIGARKMLARKEQGFPPETEGEVQAFRIGDLYILGLPFETFLGIKHRIAQEADFEKLLVLSTTNGYLGYAPTREHFLKAKEKGGTYSDSTVPFIAGRLPYTENLEDEIAAAGAGVLKKVSGCH